MSRIFLFALGLLMLAGLGPAQTLYLVSPNYCAVSEGAGNNVWPFASYNKWTYQQVHDDLTGRPRLISQICFRNDGYYGTNPQSTTLTLTLRLSSTTVTSATATGIFANNHGSDLTEVLTNATVNWASPPPPPVRPRPFMFAISFPSKPFLYKNTTGLCWEVRIHNRTGSPDNFDAADVNQYPAYGMFGSGCLATGMSNAGECHSYLKMGAATAWDFYTEAKYLAASQAGLWLIGHSDTRWGPFPLPLDLTPMGVTGCTLYTAILFAVAGQTDSGGNLTTKGTPLQIPYDPILLGQRIFSQCASADMGRKPVPLVFTGGCENFFHPNTMPVTRILVYNDDQATSTTRILRQQGLVTRFTYN